MKPRSPNPNCDQLLHKTLEVKDNTFNTLHNFIKKIYTIQTNKNMLALENRSASSFSPLGSFNVLHFPNTKPVFLIAPQSFHFNRYCLGFSVCW